MPQITDIKPQKRPGRFNIFINNQFAFAVSDVALAKADLKIDKELSDEEILQLIKEDDFIKVYDRALKFLSYRPRSEKELTDWFKRKEIGEETQKLVVTKLKNSDFINDLEFAKWWIEQRTSFKSTGLKLLKLELLQKGISREIVEDLTGETDTIKELEMARKLIKKKERSLKVEDKNELKKKIIGILSRRGFSWEIIKQIIDETVKLG